jgi:hypothetical protein
MPIVDASGRIIKWYGTTTDIDESRRQTDEIAQLYEREHAILNLLQTAFLPPFMPRVDGLSFQGVYRAATREAELGGDWYDAFVLRDGRIALSIGDACGHGLDASTAMIRLRETLRAVAGVVDTDPGLVLQMTNRSFATSLPGAIATGVFALYDPLTHHLAVASAGHPPPAILRNGKVVFLAYGDLPFGVDVDTTFATQSYVLEPGDRFVLYTDGLTEFDHDAVAGERRFGEMLVRHSDDAERLVSETLDGGQRDDVAVLVLSVLEDAAKPSWHFRSDDAGSAGDARAALVAHLRRRNLDPEVVNVAELVFGELVGNVVRHAPGSIEIDLQWRGESPFLIVRDRGRPFTLGGIGLPGDPYSERGRGLYMVSVFAAIPVVQPRFGGGNEVSVELTPCAGTGSMHLDEPVLERT